MGLGIYVPKEYGGPASHMWKKENAGTFMLGRYKRVVELSDGWIANHTTTQEFEEGWAKIKEYAAEKYPGKGYAAAYNCFAHVDDDHAKAREAAISYQNEWHTMITDEVADRWIVTGPAEEVAEKLVAYQDRGVNIFQLMCASPNQRVQMRRIGEDVVPLMK